MNNIDSYLEVTRAAFRGSGDGHVRLVHQTEIMRKPQDGEPLENWLSGKVPLYYRDPADIATAFRYTTDFRKPIRDTLLKLPSAQSFRESHFAEVLAAVFCEQVLGFQRLYSKLSLLSAQNANAHKMDIVMYEESEMGAVEFVFAEVKSSTKYGATPAKHDKGCFADLFQSLNEYKDDDRDFDLAAIEDRMRELPEAQAQRLRQALQPDAKPRVRYAGICVIDTSTRRDSEVALLAKRKNTKQLEVDLLCVAELPRVAEATYGRLDEMRKHV